MRPGLGFLAAILAGCGLWAVSVFAQSTPVQWSASIPRLNIPAGVAGDSGGGSQPDLQVGAGYAPSALFYSRLLTDLPATTVAHHYEAQLIASGWKTEYKQVDPALAAVRFSAGTPKDPLSGMLVVVPFETAKQTLVSVRLSVNGWPWTGRTGAAAAYMPQPGRSLKFASHLLDLPASVRRAEFISGKGTSNFMLYEMRLEAGDSPAALMPHFEAQLPKKGWTLTARIRDRAQHLIRRDSRPDPETDSSEIWMLTAMPGGSEIDFVFMVIASLRR